MIRSRRAKFVIFCTLSFSYIQGGLSCRLGNIHVYMRLATVIIHPFAHVCVRSRFTTSLMTLLRSNTVLPSWDMLDGHIFLFLTLEGMCVYLNTNHRSRVFCGRRAFRLHAIYCLQLEQVAEYCSGACIFRVSA